MNTKTLRCVSVSCQPMAEDAVSEILFEVFSEPTVVFTDLEARTTRVSSYCTLSLGETFKRRRLLKRRLESLASNGLTDDATRVSVRKIKKEDWAESWKRHFKPIAIGKRLLIKPSWSRRRTPAGAATIILDPGLSFGTGQHPTTHFCLEQLVDARESGRKQALLDIGTGTGILAISAAKLGYSPIAAFDFDPDAVRIAGENAMLNRIDGVHFFKKDLLKLSANTAKQYDVICANLTYDLLISGRRIILRRLKSGGRLILAGILNSQFAQVERAYKKCRLRLLKKHTKGEWTSGAFVFDAAPKFR